METKSLTQAADGLKISQATASRNLARLRAIFKDPLFIRTRRGMAPTSRAEELFPQLVNTMHSMEELFYSSSSKPEEYSGTIKIGAVDNGVMIFIASVIRDLMEKAPNLKIEIVPLTFNLYEQIESGSVQIAIYPEAPLPPDFHQSILFDDHFVCVVHKNHPLAHYTKVNQIPPPEEISRYKTIEINVGGTQNKHVAWGSPYPDAFQTTHVITPYFLSVPALLENSDLTAVIPYRTTKFFGRHASLVTLPAPKPYQTYQARLIWHHRTHKNQTLAWLRQLIIQAAAKEEA